MLLLSENPVEPGQPAKTRGGPARVQPQTQHIHVPALHARVCRYCRVCAAPPCPQALPQQAPAKEEHDGRGRSSGAAIRVSGQQRSATAGPRSEDRRSSDAIRQRVKPRQKMPVAFA